MSNKPIAFFFHWIAPVIVLGCGSFFIYAMGSRAQPERKKTPPRRSVPVEVVHAELHTGTLDIEVSGVAIPFREVVLSARVGGEIVFKSDSLSPGHFVEEGELLLRIDSQDYELDVTRLEQEVEKAKVDLERLAIDRDNAQRLLKIHRDVVAVREREVARLETLRQSEVVSEAQNDAVQLSLLTAQQQVTVQENHIRGFETDQKMLEKSRDLAALQLEKARLDQTRTEIVAPFSGVVIANHVEQNGNVVPGGKVATIEDTSSVEVRCSLHSKDMPFVLATQTGSGRNDQVVTRSVSEGHVAERSRLPLANASNSQQKVGNENAAAYRLPQVSVTVEYTRGDRIFQWDGFLSRQDGLGIDEATRTLPVRIRVPDPSGSTDDEADTENIALVRGMFVKVRLHCQPTTPIATVPESVLRPGKTVWLMRDDKLQVEKINIAAMRNGKAFVDVSDSPLTLGDAIISSPVPNARNGLAVALMQRGGKRRPKPENSDAPNKRGPKSGDAERQGPPR